MGFDNLFSIIKDSPEPEKQSKSKPSTPRKSKPKVELRGCEHCTMDKVAGIKKIMGSIKGKSRALFAQSPGPDENDEGKELVGKSGQWFWSELAKVGLKREMFDINNVMRCFPADLVEGSYDSYLKMRDPSPLELKCCSVHTDDAISKLKAKQILVLGKVAARQLLRTKALPKNKIFYSEELKAKIYLADHPSFFIRGYASQERLDAFRDTLKLFVQDGEKDDVEMADEYAYLRKQDYRLVLNKQQAIEAEKVLREHVAKGRRLSTDIESGNVAQLTGGLGVPLHTITGQWTVTACGFSPKPGLTFVYVFWHSEQNPQDGQAVFESAKRILEDPAIFKSFHYGCSDYYSLLENAGVHVRGYRGSKGHDSYLSEYLHFPDRKQYGLEECGDTHFVEFSGYKNIVSDEMLADIPDVPEKIKTGIAKVKKDYIFKHNLFDITKLTLDTLRLYNGADCDLSKRLEIDNKKTVPQALMNLYIDLSFILYKMESNGPWFDYEQHDKLKIVLPYRAATKLAEMREILGNPDFNPGAWQQVADAIYKKLKIPFPFSGKPNTAKNTLLTLGKKYKFPRLVLEWRKASKAEGTYVDGYKVSADTWGGRLRTKWFADGARTGRLRSSGDKKGGTTGKINLQNIHGDPHIQNMLVSDRRWRKVYRALHDLVKRKPIIVAFYKELNYWIDNKLADKGIPKPRPCQEVLAAEKWVEDKIEAWVRNNLPDLEVHLAFDYGQIEVRVFAFLSGDKNLKQDCQESDIHSKVGAVLTGWSEEKIKNDKKVRTSTKNCHFGIMFGSAAKGVHAFVVARTPPDQEPMTLAKVEEAMERYFARYSRAKPYFEEQREFAREHKYVETAFGMRQPLYIHEGEEDEEEYVGDDIDEDSRGSWWGNQAINGPVQGTAHQLLECGLVNILRQRKKYKKLGIPVLDVHDNLTFGVKCLDLPETYKMGRYLMEFESLETVKKDFPHIEWDVPIVTEAEASLTFGCKIELEEGFTVGGFLLKWFHKRQKQNKELQAELATIQQES